jgi:TrkA domain protein
MEIFEVKLPGLGIRYEFVTASGMRVGVLVRRDGERDLLVYQSEDEDVCSSTVELRPEESAAIVELLGGTKVTEKLSDLRHEVEGLSIEWVTIRESSPLAQKSIADGAIRTKTGASIVAVLRGDTSIPGPGPDFTFSVGDVALVVGSVQGVQSAAKLISG